MIGTGTAILGSAIIGAGASMASSGPLSSYLGRGDRRDASKVDYKTYKKQRFFDYNFDSTLGYDLARQYDQKDFDLSRRYSENSAKWATTGLRRAGLNPILAASQGFNADFGHQGQGPSGGGSMPSVGGNSFRVDPKLDLAGAAQDIGSLDVQSSTATKLRADSNVAQAQADLIKAQTLRQYVDAINEYHSQGGLSKAGVGAITRLFGSGDSKLDKVMHKSGFGVDDTTGSAVKGMSQAVDWISKMFSPTRATTPPSSAKDKKVFMSDLTNAVKLSNAVSPSPAPVVAPVKVPARLRRELTPAGRNANISPKSKRRHN